MIVDARDLVAKWGTSFHQALFDLSKGRVAGKMGGMPVVKLTTTGAKSGKTRHTMLTSPLHDDKRVILIASYGGADHHPAWYVNLRAHPDVTVTMEGRTRPMHARTASTAEKADLWPQIVAKYKGYGGYQKKTDRDIPVVILEPAGA